MKELLNYAPMVLEREKEFIRRQSNEVKKYIEDFAKQDLIFSSFSFLFILGLCYLLSFLLFSLQGLVWWIVTIFDIVMSLLNLFMIFPIVLENIMIIRWINTGAIK